MCDCYDKYSNREGADPLLPRRLLRYPFPPFPSPSPSPPPPLPPDRPNRPNRFPYALCICSNPRPVPQPNPVMVTGKSRPTQPESNRRKALVLSHLERRLPRTPIPSIGRRSHTALASGPACASHVSSKASGRPQAWSPLRTQLVNRLRRGIWRQVSRAGYDSSICTIRVKHEWVFFAP